MLLFQSEAKQNPSVFPKAQWAPQIGYLKRTGVGKNGQTQSTDISEIEVCIEHDAGGSGDVLRDIERRPKEKTARATLIRDKKSETWQMINYKT